VFVGPIGSIFLISGLADNSLKIPKEVLKVAKCSICDKGAHFGIAVSHSHRRSNKMWKSNVKSVKVNVNGAARKMYVCTSCLRSGKVERA
jgi:large subunit ribosomal protein L28